MFIFSVAWGKLSIAIHVTLRTGLHEVGTSYIPCAIGLIRFGTVRVK